MTQLPTFSADRPPPAWSIAVAQRLAFHAEGDERPAVAERLSAILPLLRMRSVAAPQAFLRALLHACLDALAHAAATRTDLAPVRADIETLCALARVAIESDCDDRPVLARARPLEGLAGAAGWAARAPGRVVWLAAMAGTPDEEGGAAARLIDDLAALDPEMPLRIMQAALGS